MAKKQTSKRTIVGSPLTPALLRELHAVDKFPATPKDFEPQANWVNMYRIWTCHGFRESGNQDVGFIRIERTAREANQPIMLKVRQEVVQTDGLLHTLDAEIKCLNNQLASPVQWHLRSSFLDPNRQNIHDLGTDEIAVVDGNIINVRARGGHKFRREVRGLLTCDWCLFEAVQRLKFDKEPSLNFDMLEGLSLLKQGQRLSYRGDYPMKLSSNNVSLHRFDQLGDGILPYEYWLDNNHRLMAATSMNKAYILDDQAEKTIRQRIEQLRKSYRKSKSAVRK
jgi:hypothetical protein